MVGRVPKVLLAVLAGLLTSQLALLLTTMYLHRTVTHRAMTMRSGLTFACRAVVWFSTGIKPREWAAVHRRHHAYTDVPGDPHSPVLDGYWKVQIYNVGLYKKAAKDAETLRKYSRDIKVDKWDKFVFDRGFVGLGPWVLRFLGDFRLAFGDCGCGRACRQLPPSQLGDQCHRAPLRQGQIRGFLHQ